MNKGTSRAQNSWDFPVASLQSQEENTQAAEPVLKLGEKATALYLAEILQCLGAPTFLFSLFYD